jgi:hypothetical protein
VAELDHDVSGSSSLRFLLPNIGVWHGAMRGLGIRTQQVRGSNPRASFSLSTT